MRPDHTERLTVLPPALQARALDSLLPWVMVNTITQEVMACSTSFADHTGLQVGNQFPGEWLLTSSPAESTRRSAVSFDDLRSVPAPGSTFLISSEHRSIEARLRRSSSTAYRVVTSHVTPSTLLLMGHWSQQSHVSRTMQERLHGKTTLLEQRRNALKRTQTQVRSMLTTLSQDVHMIAGCAGRRLEVDSTPWSSHHAMLTGTCEVIERLLDGFQTKAGTSPEARRLSLGNSMRLLRHAVGDALRRCTLQGSLDPTYLVDDSLLCNILGVMAHFYTASTPIVFDVLVDPDPTSLPGHAVVVNLRIEHATIPTLEPAKLHEMLRHRGFSSSTHSPGSDGTSVTELVSDVVACTPPRPCLEAVATTYTPKDVKKLLSHTTVLVADDSQIGLQMMYRYVRRAAPEANVVTARDGKELVTAYDNALKTTTSDKIFVITDVEMPNMDGFEAARQLRAKKYLGPILFVTGNKDDASRAAASKAAADHRWAFRSKPITAPQLVSAIGTLLMASHIPSPTKSDHDAEALVSTCTSRSGDTGGGGGGGHGGSSSDSVDAATCRTDAPASTPSDPGTPPPRSALSARWPSPEASAAENIHARYLPLIGSSVLQAGYHVGFIDREGNWLSESLIGGQTCFAKDLVPSSATSLADALTAFRQGTTQPAQLSLECRRSLTGSRCWWEVVMVPMQPTHILVMARPMTLEEAADISAAVREDGRHTTDAKQVEKELKRASDRMQQLLKVSGHVFRNVLTALTSVLGDSARDEHEKLSESKRLVSLLSKLLREVQTATKLFTKPTDAHAVEDTTTLEPLQILVDELSDDLTVTSIPRRFPDVVRGPLAWLRRLIDHLTRWGTSSQPPPLASSLHCFVLPGTTTASISLTLRYPDLTSCAAANPSFSTTLGSNVPTCHDGRLPNTAGMLGPIVRMLAQQKKWKLVQDVLGRERTLTLSGPLQPPSTLRAHPPALGHTSSRGSLVAEGTTYGGPSFSGPAQPPNILGPGAHALSDAAATSFVAEGDRHDAPDPSGSSKTCSVQ